MMMDWTVLLPAHDGKRSTHDKKEHNNRYHKMNSLNIIYWRRAVPGSNIES